jgi:hypothetical protein
LNCWEDFLSLLVRMRSPIMARWRFVGSLPSKGNHDYPWSLDLIAWLVVDAPVTIWIAIAYSRAVVASIKEVTVTMFKDEGLEDGYKFLDKIMQIPFCLPAYLTNESCKAKNYMQKFFEKDHELGLIADWRFCCMKQNIERSLIEDKDLFSKPWGG